MPDGASIISCIRVCTMKETIKITIKDAMELGIQWEDICKETQLSEWALSEGYSENNFIDIPFKWIKINDES